MRSQFGDMWSAWSEADLFLITACSTLNNQGCLVMRSRSGKQAREKFEGVDWTLGAAVAGLCPTVKQRDNQAVHYPGYGLLVSGKWPKAKLGLFQTRFHWSDDLDGRLLRLSAGKLQQWTTANPYARVHLAFPGQSDGKVDWWNIEPYLEPLPDSVTVWREQAPFVPDMILIKGTAEYGLAHGPGTPDGPKPNKQEMEAHFWRVTSEFLETDEAEIKLRFRQLFTAWGREYWQRVTQYRTLAAYLSQLRGGETEERAQGAAFQIARNHQEER